MNEFQKNLEALKKGINDLMTKEMSKEQIDNLKGLTSRADELSNIHTKTESDLSDIKDAYIKAVKNEGSTEPPKQEGGEPPKPKSLEECINDVLKETKS